MDVKEIVVFTTNSLGMNILLKNFFLFVLEITSDPHKGHLIISHTQVFLHVTVADLIK